MICLRLGVEMATGLPYEIYEAVIQCFGKCFHYKDNVAAFMLSSDVPKALVNKYRDQPKYLWARRVLEELGSSNDGHLVQSKLLTNLCKLRKLPDSDVPDRDAGLDALRTLKKLAIEHDLYVEEQKSTSTKRDILAGERQKLVTERAEKLQTLHKIFCDGLQASNRQSAGYSLEDLLQELFALFELEYKKSFKTATEQIDGHVNFEGFDYLIEARWRKDQPTFQEIGGFKAKVDTKLESTRGFFLSVQGFRPEVIANFEGRGCNIIFINGEDLIYLLEGRIDLRDGLKFKIENAAQKGHAFVPLRDYHR